MSGLAEDPITDFPPSADGTVEVWTDALRLELKRNWTNGCVGRAILSETTDYRIWSVALTPGERMGFHRHVLDYFRVALTGGKVRSLTHRGEVRAQDLAAGEVRHTRFSEGEFLVHDLTNVGPGPIAFIVTERLDSANAPLPIPDHVRRRVDPLAALQSAG